MTVGTIYEPLEYIEDGATLFHAITWPFFDADEIIVTRIDGTSDVNEHVLTLGVDYNVAGGGGLVGSITKTSGGTVGATLKIQRHTHRSQLLDYEAGDDFPAEMHEEGLDRLEMQIQELEAEELTAENVRDLIGRTLVAGNGIVIVVNDEANTITISTVDADALIDGLPDCVMLSGDQQTWDGITGTGSGGLSEEDVQDIIADMIEAGAGISVAYDDAANRYVITNTAPGGGVVGPTNEQIMDLMATFLAAGTGISLAYNDAGDQLVIGNTGAGGGGGGTPLSITDQSLTANGHMTLSNGLIIQWGSASFAPGSVTIFYPVPYTLFSVPVMSACGDQDVGAQDNPGMITSASVTGFSTYNANNNASTGWWIAIGK